MPTPKQCEKVSNDIWKEVMKDMPIFKPILPFMISRKECDELIEKDKEPEGKS